MNSSYALLGASYEPCRRTKTVPLQDRPIAAGKFLPQIRPAVSVLKPRPHNEQTRARRGQIQG